MMRLYLSNKLFKAHRCPMCDDESGRHEEFGKPMARREGESSNDYMSRVIRHLVNDKGYDQKRAVAAAYSMTGHPKGKMNKGLFIAK